MKSHAYTGVVQLRGIKLRVQLSWAFQRAKGVVQTRIKDEPGQSKYTSPHRETN